MRLININGNINYIDNACNIGCITDGQDVILIDSGLEDRVAKKIIGLLDKEGYKIRAIINTHSHTDHCGGNSYIQGKEGALIYAPGFEAAIIENPYLEPIYLSGGAAPLKELVNKFTTAKPSRVDHIINKGDTSLKIGSVTLEVVPLLGHAVNHIGIAIDNTLYCGDAVISVELLLKHKIPFNVDIGRQLESLDFLKESNYEVYIPAHGKPMNKEELIDTVNENIRTLENINNTIVESLATPKTLEDLEYNVLESHNITINTLTQYALLQTAIRAHINYLYSENIVKKSIEANRVCWKLKNTK